MAPRSVSTMAVVPPHLMRARCPTPPRHPWTDRPPLELRLDGGSVRGSRRADATGARRAPRSRTRRTARSFTSGENLFRLPSSDDSILSRIEASDDPGAVHGYAPGELADGRSYGVLALELQDLEYSERHMVVRVDRDPGLGAPTRTLATARSRDLRVTPAKRLTEKVL